MNREHVQYVINQHIILLKEFNKLTKKKGEVSIPQQLIDDLYMSDLNMRDVMAFYFPSHTPHYDIKQSKNTPPRVWGRIMNVLKAILIIAMIVYFFYASVRY